MEESRNGNQEGWEALAESRRLFCSRGRFSEFVNLLMLTGPLFMHPVYDQDPTLRSEAMLVMLVVIVATLFLTMGALEHARGRALAGARLQARLGSRVLWTILVARSTSPAERSRPTTGLRDLLEAIQRFASRSSHYHSSMR